MVPVRKMEVYLSLVPECGSFISLKGLVSICKGNGR